MGFFTMKRGRKIVNNKYYCNCCKKFKLIDKFYKQITNPGGRAYTCKECLILRTIKAQRLKLKKGLCQVLGCNKILYNKTRCKYHTVKNRHIAKRFRVKNPEKRILVTLKTRSKSKNIKFNLTIKDICIPKICPILKIPIILTNSRLKYNSPSVDRIDNTKGYEKGNIQIISNLANCMKNEATPEQLKLFAKWVNKTYGY